MKILDYYLKTYQGTATKSVSNISYSTPTPPIPLRDINPLFCDTEGYCFPLERSDNNDLLNRFGVFTRDALEYFLETRCFEKWPDIIIASSVLPNQVSVDSFRKVLLRAGIDVGNNIHFVSTACTSAATALDLFKLSRLEKAIIIGIDLFSEITVSGFNSIGAFAPAFPKPFSESNGMGLGDGVGAIYISKNNDTRDYVFSVDVVQLSIESFHATTPDPEARVAFNMVNAAIHYMQPCEDITWCLHATGTQSNDKSELSLIRKVRERYGGTRFRFLEYKSIFGHTLGACPLVELIATINQKFHDTESDRPNLFDSERGISRRVINTNLAFGGHNSIIGGVING